MLFDELNKICRGVAGKRRLRKMRISRKKIIGRRVQIGEVTAPAAGDQNLFTDALRALENQNPPPARASLGGAHQASSACSENDDVVFCFALLVHFPARADYFRCRDFISPLLKFDPWRELLPKPSSTERRLHSLRTFRWRVERFQEGNNLPAFGLGQLRPHRHAMPYRSIRHNPE